MIERILPTGVSSSHLRDFTSAGPLLPGEDAALGRACPARVSEFTAGRHCAQAALARLGVPAAALLRGPAGAPQWPAGTAGSITHCTGYCAAAATATTMYASVGIDAEPNLPLPRLVAARITQPSERRWLAGGHVPAGQVPAGHRVHWDRLLFCAKESVYKAWAPLTGGAWLGFTDATVTVDAAAGLFHAVLEVPPPLVDGVPQASFAGRFLATPDLLLTAVVVHRRPATRNGGTR